MTEKKDIQGRDPRWRDWYPTVVPDFDAIPVEGSPYGEPNIETLSLFDQLEPGSKIGDIGGGEGRFALPLARGGYHVLVTDVNKRHLQRAKQKSTLAGITGSILPVQADATAEFPIKDGSLDAVLNAGFGYLIPPDQLDPLFGKMVKALRRGGLLVFEFATNRDRRKSVRSRRSLIGENEYNYSHDQGLRTLTSLADRHGITDLSTQTKTIHFVRPYYMHNDLIIAHGIKR